MDNYLTDQENFWAGGFGTEYIGRNKGDTLLASNLHFFSKALTHATGIQDCIEFGANIGMNLKALKLLYPGVPQFAIEINAVACGQLREVIQAEHIICGSILDFEPSRTWDLVLIKGVLIHINPDKLQAVYDRLYESTGRYILLAEYYNPSPVAILYRGYSDKLFKRDFAGEMLDRYSNLKLVDYGFAYRRDPHFPQDDINWFLMKKEI